MSEQRIAVHYDRFGMMRIVTERPSQVFIVDERHAEDRVRQLKNTHVSYVGAVSRLIAGRPVGDETSVG